MSQSMDRMSDIFARAEEFVWKNARLLDRRLFAFEFRGGSREAVLAALGAYQNADGGFGNALEPDIRCPDSQPVPVGHALEIMAEAGGDADMVRRACDYLVTITTEEGGVPFVLPSASAYPHAPWWGCEGAPPASLNPTAEIAGLLYRMEVRHPWLEPAAEYCWRRIPGLQPSDMHEMGVVFTFLQHAPDRERAERELQRLGEHLLTSGLVADVEASGYVRKPLDWAPTPDHPLRPLFTPEQIHANMDHLVAAQQEDGGWQITWPPVSPTCELEWRGWITRRNLGVLRANGRLSGRGEGTGG
jgi:hypothetical protein